MPNIAFEGRYTELPPNSIEDLWLFPRRGALIDVDYTPLPGGFIPEVPYYLMLRFSRRGGIVYDPMAGAMVTHRVARRSDLGRVPISVDLTMRGERSDPIYEELIIADARTFDPGPVDLIIWHPPYRDVIRFSTHEADLSTMPVLEYWESVSQCLGQFDRALKKDRYCCVVIGNVYKEQQIRPLAFHLLALVGTGFPHWKLKGLVVKDIRGNNESGAGLQRYRAVHLMDSFVFRYEFILVFKKEGEYK